MSSSAISVRELGKKYQLGATLKHDTLRDQLASGLRGFRNLLRGKRDSPGHSIRASQDFWAIRNISFDVRPGEIFGIIGRNGAGKSTLLKVLAQITTPTEGEVRLRGRVSSLLEVGTGFHPELTGMENIFLNGSILGMSRAEIRSKLDEIIDFSGVEKFLDTPVKRYSSGMYVRLAFSVAAHLEPEILIVDEVLAVGDAEFQKRCLGKMGEVARNDGRTVIFVSHNLTAIRTLCHRCVWIADGAVKMLGECDSTVDQYLMETVSTKHLNKGSGKRDKEGPFHLAEAQVVLPQSADENGIDVTTPFDLKFCFAVDSNVSAVRIGYDLTTPSGEVVFSTGCGPISIVPEKEQSALCRIPGNLLNDGQYCVTFMAFDGDMRPLFREDEVLAFQIRDVAREHSYLGKVNGAVRPKLDWQCQELNR